MKRIDLIIDALEAGLKLSDGFISEWNQINKALAAAHELKAELAKPEQEFYPDWDMIKPFHERIKELEEQLAKPEPIYVMGNYAGEGKVVSASFGLPKGAFEFAPYTGAGEASKIKHSIEPEQEPVGEIVCEDLGRPFSAMQIRTHFFKSVPPVGTKLYTAPLRKEWVGLTDDEFKFIASKYSLNTPSGLGYFQEEIEAKLKEKNS